MVVGPDDDLPPPSIDVSQATGTATPMVGMNPVEARVGFYRKARQDDKNISSDRAYRLSALGFVVEKLIRGTTIGRLANVSPISCGRHSRPGS